MNRPDTVNIPDVIDNSRIGSLQITLFALCAACLILDGFDVQATGYVAADMSRDLSLSGTQFSYVASAGLVGILLGALFFGGLGDKYGRRPVLIAATLAFSILTLLTGWQFVQTCHRSLRILLRPLLQCLAQQPGPLAPGGKAAGVTHGGGGIPM